MLQVLKPEGYGHISPLKLKPQRADTELQNLDVHPARFWSCFGVFFLTSILSFRMGICIKRYYILEGCNLYLYLDFARNDRKGLI